MAAIVSVSGIHKYFRRGSEQIDVLEDLTLDVPEGEFLALMGPSGSGKTTLLRIIAGLEPPDAGTVLYRDDDITGRSARDRNVGFVFQHYALFRHMTVFENVAFGLRVRRWPEAKVRERVGELLRLVRLEEKADRYPAALSGGQRQRIALARVFLKNPPILILDEGTSALDNISERCVQQAINAARVDRTVILVAHRLTTLCDADRILVFEAGRLVEVGPYHELVKKGGLFTELVVSAERNHSPSPETSPAPELAER